jgi:hypothetical protein
VRLALKLQSPERCWESKWVSLQSGVIVFARCMQIGGQIGETLIRPILISRFVFKQTELN